ncbi:Hypothetical protein A7982_06781 [Minicystis rosea]|nr:Hypothetical protein A7982_06781 [Minicystis rosea]
MLERNLVVACVDALDDTGLEGSGAGTGQPLDDGFRVDEHHRAAILREDRRAPPAQLRCEARRAKHVRRKRREGAESTQHRRPSRASHALRNAANPPARAHPCFGGQPTLQRRHTHAAATGYPSCRDGTKPIMAAIDMAPSPWLAVAQGG